MIARRNRTATSSQRSARRVCSGTKPSNVTGRRRSCGVRSRTSAQRMPVARPRGPSGAGSPAITRRVDASRDASIMAALYTKGANARPTPDRPGPPRWANLPPPWGRRPVRLVARNRAYEILARVMVAPLTTTIRRIPTAVRLEPGVDGVDRRCVISLDNIMPVRRDWLDGYIADLSREKMREVDQAIRYALDLRDQRS